MSRKVPMAPHLCPLLSNTLQRLPPPGGIRSGSQPQVRGPQSGMNTCPRLTVKNGTTA